MQSFLALILLVSFILFGAPSVARSQWSPPSGMFIPVIADIYPNSGVTVKEVKEYIRLANDLLKQANIRLVLVDIISIEANSGGPNYYGGDNGDGEINDAEVVEVRNYGAMEIAQTQNAKGIKIAFVKTLKINSSTQGLSVRGNPTIIVKEGSDAQAKARTIAHDIGHVLSLDQNHLIQDMCFSPNITANGAGHASDPYNLMSVSTGTQLTHSQIEKIWSSRYIFGKCSTKSQDTHPSDKDPTQYGKIVDPINDDLSSLGYYDITEIVLVSSDENAGYYQGQDPGDIMAKITVANILPVSGAINAYYAIGFDCDANPSTGISYANYEGIDRIVYVTVTQNGSLKNLNGFVADTAYNNASYFPTLQEKPVYSDQFMFVDTDNDAVPVEASFSFKIPKNLLDLNAIDVPFVAASGIFNTIGVFNNDIVFDSTDYSYFDRDRYLDDPTITALGYTGDGIPVPGSDYAFTISGFPPDAPFHLFLNEELVMTDSVDGNGSFTGTFKFPSYLDEDEVHFLTAFDPFSNEFAYSITCPNKVPKIGIEPSAYDFGSIVVGESSNMLVLTISNTGYDILNIEYMTQTNSSEFINSSCKGENIPPSSIGPHDSVQGGFYFKPSSTGDRISIIEFHSNDTLEPIKNVKLKGRGVGVEEVHFPYIPILYYQLVPYHWPWPELLDSLKVVLDRYDPFQTSFLVNTYDYPSFVINNGIGPGVVSDWFNYPFQTSLLGYNYNY